MSNYRIIHNTSRDAIVLSRAKWCKSFLCHLRGLQFVRNLPADEGLLFVTNSQSIANTAIHMFFMFMDIAVIWVDEDGVVVDKKIAKPWRPYYAPQKPAMYYIEANTHVYDTVEIGDTLKFNEA